MSGGVRELLMNVVKHAKARNAWIRMHEKDGRLSILVKDDGIGFNPQEILTKSIKSHTFGLFSIKERLLYLGGRLEHESKPGAGTIFTITAPLKSQVKEEGR